MIKPMDKKDLRIVFFGTPEFAVESLKRLVEGGYNIVGVVTMPDKPAGRGHHLLQSDVKRYAVEHGLRVLQPVRLKDEAFVDELRSLKAHLQIIIAFRMLPEVVWAMPPMGTFNLHASLLPKYRGAAPINWAVMNGDTRTGVTTFFLKHEIDTGDIIEQRDIAIGRTDNVGVVHDKLMLLGADMVMHTVEAILAGTVHPVAQEQLLTAGQEPRFTGRGLPSACITTYAGCRLILRHGPSWPTRPAAGGSSKSWPPPNLRRLAARPAA